MGGCARHTLSALLLDSGNSRAPPEQHPVADGMNEAGLAVGLFYHPGFAEYPDYDPATADQTIGAVDVVGYLLTQFATIDEVKAGMALKVKMEPMTSSVDLVPIACLEAPETTKSSVVQVATRLRVEPATIR